MAATTIGPIATTIVAAFKAKSVELGSEILPFWFRQLRLINTFNPGPQLPFFPSDPRTKVVITKGDISLCPVRRRHNARYLTEQIFIGIAAQKQRPLLRFCQRHIAELNLLHPWPGKLRLDRLP
jgi:hypothetical protein